MEENANELISAVEESANEQEALTRLRDQVTDMNVNMTNRTRDTLLHIAVKKMYKDIVKLLLVRRADTQIRNDRGVTVEEMFKEMEEIVGIFNYFPTRDPGSRAVNRPVRQFYLSMYESTSNSSNVPVLENEFYDKQDTSAIKGSLFQVKLLTLFLLRGINKKYSFSMATEMKTAQKFDDLIFRYGNPLVSLLLQAKHRAGTNNMTISRKDLFTDILNGDFALPKYYFSFQEIIRNVDFGQVKLVILFTNANLKKEDEEKYFNKYEEEICILNTKSGDKGNVYCCKKEPVIEELKPFLIEYKIKTFVDKVVNSIINERSIDVESDIIFKELEGFLWKIFEIEEERIIGIRQNFRADSSDLNYKKIMKQAECKIIEKSNTLKKKLEKKKDDLDRLNCKKKLSDEETVTKQRLSNLTDLFDRYLVQDCPNFNLSDINILLKNGNVEIIFSNENRDAPDDICIPEDDIEKFIDHFVLAVNQPNEEDLSLEIEKELSQENSVVVNDLTSEFAADQVQKKMLEWFKEKLKSNKGRFLSYEDGNKMLREISTKINGFITSVLSVENWNNIEKFQVHFKDDVLKELREKISSGENFFHISCPNESVLSLMKIYRALIAKHKPEYIYIEFDSLARSNTQKRIYDAVNLGTFKGLIIYCPTKKSHVTDSDKKIVEKLCAIVSKDNPQIIVVTEKNDSFAHLFSNAVYYEIIHRFDNLNEETQDKLLTKDIIFNGRQTTLGQLIGETLEIIDVKTLSKLIQTNETLTLDKTCSRTSHSDAAFTSVCEKLVNDNFINHLLKEDSVQYIISGLEQCGDDNLKAEFLEKLQLNEENFFLKNVHFQNLSETECANYFRQYCRSDIKDVVYWIHWKTGAFFLNQIYNPNYYVHRSFERQKKELVPEKLKEKIISRDITEKYAISNCTVQELANLLKVQENNIQAATGENLILLDIHDKVTDTGVTVTDTGNGDNVSCSNKQDRPVHWFEVGNESQIIWKRSLGSLHKLREMIRDTDSWVSCEERDLLSETDQVVIISDDPGMGKTTTLSRLEQTLENVWIIRVNLRNRNDTLTNMSMLNDKHSFKGIEDLLKIVDTRIISDLEKNVIKYFVENREPKDGKRLLFIFDGFDEIDSSNQENIIKMFKYLKDFPSIILWISTRPYTLRILENNLSTFAINFKALTNDEQKQFLIDFWKTALALTAPTDTEGDRRIEKIATTLIKKTSYVFGIHKSRFFGIPLQLKLLSEGFLPSVYNNTEECFFQNFDILDLYKLFIEAKYDIYFKDKIEITNKLGALKPIIIKVLSEFLRYKAFIGLFSDEKEVTSTLFKNDFKSLFTEDVATCLNSIGIIQMKDENVFSFMHKSFEEFLAAQSLTGYLRRDPSLSIHCIKQFLMQEILQDRSTVVFQFINRILAQNSKVLKAIVNGDILAIESIEERDIDVVDALNRNPLHLAVQINQTCAIDIVRKLMKLRCKVFAKDSFGRTPLHYACYHGNSAQVRYMLQDFDFERKVNMTELSKLLSDDFVITVLSEVTVTDNISKSINILDENGKTAMDYAFLSEWWVVVYILQIKGGKYTEMNEETRNNLTTYIKQYLTA